MTSNQSRTRDFSPAIILSVLNGKPCFCNPLEYRSLLGFMMGGLRESEKSRNRDRLSNKLPPKFNLVLKACQQELMEQHEVLRTVDFASFNQQIAEEYEGGKFPEGISEITRAWLAKQGNLLEETLPVRPLPQEIIAEVRTRRGQRAPRSAVR